MNTHSIKSSCNIAKSKKQHPKTTSTQLHIIGEGKFTVCPVFKDNCNRNLGSTLMKMMVDEVRQIAGVWEQKLIIHYNCVGSITIPEDASIPVPNISVNTRKGVYVNYANN